MGHLFSDSQPTTSWRQQYQWLARKSEIRNVYICIFLFNAIQVIGKKETEGELCDETVLPRQPRNVLSTLCALQTTTRVFLLCATNLFSFYLFYEDDFAFIFIICCQHYNKGLAWKMHSLIHNDTLQSFTLNSQILLKLKMSGTVCPKRQNKVRILMWSSIDIMRFLLYFKIYLAKLCFSKCFRFWIIPKSLPHDACLEVHSSVNDTMEGYICLLHELKGNLC